MLSWEEGGKAFNETLEIDTLPGVHLIRSLPGAFTPEECARIVRMGDARERMTALAEGDERDKNRHSEVAWIAPEAEAHWLYHKLAVLFGDVNRYYEFELIGLVDPPQYAVYEPGHHFGWHVDVGAEAASLRKLSLSVQLTDSADYVGGELEFPFPGQDVGNQREIGTAIIFPSFLAHRVSSVTSGVRRSLVAWASGPTFR